MTPRDAIEYAPPSPVERKAFEQLRAAGVIREAQPACYWFDLDRMGREPRRRDPKTYVAIALAVVLACLAYMLYRG
ncbi:hypothetical protein [Sphingomonas sp. MS122]|uniref:hypothetical protein n=1 Tax=Sphingomonas sp. MS122 TaxID=3412683 RepID=UPI003C2BDF8E